MVATWDTQRQVFVVHSAKIILNGVSIVFDTIEVKVPGLPTEAFLNLFWFVGAEDFNKCIAWVLHLLLKEQQK
eukprot:5487492-Amphidinium_carterae.1